MNRNEYLESYKIQVVRRVMSGESHNKVAKELGIVKSTSTLTFFPSYKKTAEPCRSA